MNFYILRWVKIFLENNKHNLLREIDRDVLYYDYSYY